MAVEMFLICYVILQDRGHITLWVGALKISHHTVTFGG